MTGKQYLQNIARLYTKIDNGGNPHFNAFDIENWMMDFENRKLSEFEAVVRSTVDPIVADEIMKRLKQK